MPVYKDKNGTWYVMTRCDDWPGAAQAEVQAWLQDKA